MIILFLFCTIHVYVFFFCNIYEFGSFVLYWFFYLFCCAIRITKYVQFNTYEHPNRPQYFKQANIHHWVDATWIKKRNKYTETQKILANMVSLWIYIFSVFFFSCVWNHIVWASFALILSDVKYKLNIWTHMFTYNKAGKTIFYV